MSVLNWKQRLFNHLQGILPQQWLSRVMLTLTNWRWRPWKNLQINCFIQRYGVDMQEAEHTNVEAYEHFNAFFTRSLRDDARPIAPETETLVGPVDGRVSQAGAIHNDSIIQAKGHDYAIGQLLAGDQTLANIFTNGAFATLYLAPRDYHRVHMPCDGRLQRMIHVPGRRFAVNPTSVAGIDHLFARNERVVSLFATPAGSMALVMVGALFVGSLQTVWTGRLSARGRGEIQNYDYRNARISLAKGEEMGRFNMGSTVILLFPAGRTQWHPAVQPGRRICLGENLGHIV